MTSRYVCATLLVSALMLSSCTWIGLRDDILQKTPPWEDENIIPLIPPTARSESDLAKLPPNSLGLGNLVKQVLGITLTVKSFTGSGESLVADETNPLPEDLAKNPVTKAIVLSMLHECKKIHCVPTIEATEGGSIPETIPNTWLTNRDFRCFGDSLLKSLWLPNRTQKALTSGFLQKKGSKPTWQEIFLNYAWAYYTGTYVDRYGVAYQKPKVDFTITNEVIVAFADIFQDSLWDYVFLALVDDIKDPVVYYPEHKDQFVNTSKKVPTFAKIAWKIKGNDNDIPGLVEEARPDTTPKTQAGLRKTDVCVVHNVSGISGDASKLLNGTIIRAFGGGNIFVLLGFVATYGKYSIGDHQTLSKLIDATVETYVKRSSDWLFSTILYQPEDQITRLSEKNTGALIVKQGLDLPSNIGDILECFPSS